MLGLYLNLLISSFAAIALVSGVSFFIQEKDSGYIRCYILFFGITTFLICQGYALTGLNPCLEYGFILRLIALYGIDVFLLLEFAFILLEIKTKSTLRMVLIGFFTLFLIFDLVIFGRPGVVSFTRYEYHTAFETIGRRSRIFHYTYITAITVSLISLASKWLNSKKAKRDKHFVLEIIIANFFILFSAIPDIFKNAFTFKYPTFGYSVAFAFVYFSLWLSTRQHISFSPTIKHVSEEIFYSIDVPILIFDFEGKINLYNPCAKEKIQIEEEKTPAAGEKNWQRTAGYQTPAGKNGAISSPLTLRSLFTLTDVEMLHLLSKMKNGNDEIIRTKIKSSGEECRLSCTVTYDNIDEPYCIIGRIISLDIENKAE